MNFRGMIISVGGSSEPTKKMLSDGNPDYVLFVVSAGSRSKVEDEVLSEMNYIPQYGYSEVPDHQDIGLCYQQIRIRIEQWLKEYKLRAEDVAVDITGGTKAMSAALMLAAVEHFHNFTYVGGSRRDSDNLGTVITGSEKMIKCQNPWITYAIPNIERANRLLEGFHADSAAEILQDAAQKCNKPLRTRLEAFAGFAKALGFADQFNFKAATSELHRWKHTLELSLEYCNLKNEDLASLDRHWKSVNEEVNKNNNKTAGNATLLELIANADRRAKQSRYDDATGRLYRAVELRGQQLVKKAFGAELGKLPLESLPVGSHERIKTMLGEPEDDIYRLGVQNLFRVLEFSENQAISEKAHIHDRLKNHLSGRNGSLLAHGLVPVKKESFESFLQSVLSSLDISDSCIPYWPQLELRLSHA